MATITVRDIPEPLYESIRQSAVKNRRSINSEIIHLLEIASSFAIPSSSSSPQEKLEAIRKVRAAIGVKTIKSAAEITAAKREGRS